jgi:hypothetical protein
MVVLDREKGFKMDGEEIKIIREKLKLPPKKMGQH